MFDVAACGELRQHEYFSGHDKDTIDLYLDAMDQFAKEYLFPHLVEMDRKQPELIDGRIEFIRYKDIMRISGENGWIAYMAYKEVGGMQMPLQWQRRKFYFSCCKLFRLCIAGLTLGAAHLIESFADKNMQDEYSRKCLPAMAGNNGVTEPGAGSSLSDVVSTAEKTGRRHYKITGQKIFISCGDSDAVDNVVHL